MRMEGQSEPSQCPTMSRSDMNWHEVTTDGKEL